ncbi:MAG: O-antigen ligase family protein [bacterium]
MNRGGIERLKLLKNPAWLFGGALVFLALVIAVVSSSAAVGVFLGGLIFIAALFFPLQVLFALLCYLPFEPFLLKFLSDEFFLYAKYGSEVLIYLLFLIAFVRRLIRTKWSFSKFDYPVLALLVALLVSALINQESPMIAVFGVRQIIRFVFLFYIVYWLEPSVTWLKKLLLALLSIAIFESLLGLAQTVFGQRLTNFLSPGAARFAEGIQVSGSQIETWEPTRRVFGTMGRYDQLGTFLAPVLLFGLAYLYEAKNYWKRYREWAPLAILGLVALALSYSRSAWIGFALGFMLITLGLKRDRRVWIYGGIGAAVLAVVILFSGTLSSTLTAYPGQTLTERFLELFSYERYRGEYYGLGRLYWMVQTPAKVVADSPIFGVGPGMFGGGVAAALKNTTAYEILGLPFGVYGSEGYIDNNWFSLWGEIGTLGLIVFLWLWWVLGREALMLYRRSADEFSKTLALGFLGFMAAFALNGLLATMFEIRTIAPYFWALGGAIMLLNHRASLKSLSP